MAGLELRGRVIRHLARSPLSALLLMTLCFLFFGYFSINLFFLFEANIDLIRRHGFLALKEGAALQFVMLLGSGLASVLCYSGWKVCERLLVDWLVRDRQP